MLTRNFYESITNTMGPKTMRSLELAVGDGTGTYSEPWGLHDLYHRLRNCELTFPWQRHVSVSVHMTNVSHHCPPTTAAITWPGSRTYVVYAPAMTFAPSQLSWLHCVLLSFKKENEKAQDTYPENAPPGRVRKKSEWKRQNKCFQLPGRMSWLYGPCPRVAIGSWNSGFENLGFKESVSTARLIRSMILLLIAQLEQCAL